MKRFVLALVGLLIVATMAEAQMPQPITKRPVTQEEFALAIEKNDQSALNVDCMQLVDAMPQVYGERFAALKTCGDLANYLRRLTVAVCPEGMQANFARRMPNGTLDLYGFTRECRVGERWLLDNNEGVWVASLLCGNFITNNKVPVQHTAAEAPPERVVVEEPPTPDIEGALRKAIQEELAKQPPAQQTAYVEPEDAWKPKPLPWHSWGRKSGKVFWVSLAAGAAVGTYCAVEKCFRNVLEVNVHNGIER